MLLTSEQLDKCLDGCNECNELLSEANKQGRMNKHTSDYIKSEILLVFEEIKTEKYEVIRKHIYDIGQIIDMDS